MKEKQGMKNFCETFLNSSLLAAIAVMIVANAGNQSKDPCMQTKTSNKK